MATPHCNKYSTDFSSTSRKTEEKKPLRINSGGNFCEHNPQYPNLNLKKTPKRDKGGLPPVLIKAFDRSETYYHQPETLPSLNHLEGNPRQARSERREAEVLTLKCIITHTDLISLRVGIPMGECFTNLPIRTIIKETGMSAIRVHRAISGIKRSGILETIEVRKKLKDGSWISEPAIKKVSPYFFGALGLGQQLARNQAKMKKILKIRGRQSRRNKEKGHKSNFNANEARIALLLQSAIYVKKLKKAKKKETKTSTFRKITPNQEEGHKAFKKAMNMIYSIKHPPNA